MFQHTWSLAVEEHSYMFLAVLVLFAGRSGDRVGRLTLGLAILLMTVAAMRWFSGNNAWLYLHTESRAASILVSFAIATQAAANRAETPTLNSSVARALGVGRRHELMAFAGSGTGHLYVGDRPSCDRRQCR